MEHIDSHTFWKYVTGNSSKDQTAIIKKHLLNCEDCMSEFKLLSQLESTLNAVGEETTSLGFSDKVIRKIENEMAFERKSKKLAKLFPFAIIGGFTLAILMAIIIGVRTDLDLIQLEQVLTSKVGLLILTACGLLWGLYFIDRICKKIFLPMDYANLR